jgi:hypothetical protein
MTEVKKVKVERYSMTVYCKNCLVVTECLIPTRTPLSIADCVNCGVVGMLLTVKSYPGSKK